MRILHIDTGAVMRGGQELLMMSARGLRKKGHAQTIACPPGSPLAAMAKAEGFSVLPIGWSYLAAARAIRRLLRAETYDLVSAHDARAQTVSYLATLGLPIVRVANRLVVFEPRNRLVHRLKYTYTCDVVVALSQAVKETLVRTGIPAEHIEVITGGIDFPEHLLDPGARERMRAQWGLAADDFVIGHVAAFTAEKGQLDALDALLALLPKHPNIRMLLVGDGPLRGDPRTQEKVRAAREAAQLPGYLKPSAEFYAGLDLFLINSTAEALGLSALYAMAHEVPVVATSVGGLPEVVGDTGWLIPPSDPRALAGAIESVIQEAAADPSAMRERRRRAREQARRFSAEATSERTETLYHEILRARKLPAGSA